MKPDESDLDIGRPPKGCALALAVVFFGWAAVLLWVWPW